MALIGEIRKRSWLLVVMVGLGMGGFILMDMTSQSQSLFGGGVNTVGSIDGQKVNINEFQLRDQILYGNSSADQSQRSEALWEYYVQERIVKQEAEKLGFGVSADELNQMFDVRSPKFSYLIRDYFGQGLTPEIYNNYRNSLSDPNVSREELERFKLLEDRVELDRMGQKLSILVSKGIYTPTWMAEMNHNDDNVLVDFRFVGVPYASIQDDDFSVSDGEISSYLKKHANEYRQEEETRTFDYVVFDVTPTSADSALLTDKLSAIASELKTTDNDSSVVLQNGGIIDVTYFTEDDLSPVLKDTINSIGIDSVYGPYVDGQEFKIVKVLDRKEIPDSVQARHILLPIQNPNAPAEIIAANALADSLKNLIEVGGIPFDTIALNHSADNQSKVIGGDLGMKEVGPNVYLKQMNDLIFYTGKTNQLYVIQSQVGVHIIEITKQVFSGTTGYQLAYVNETIVPTSGTETAAYNKAFEFVANNRNLEELKTAVEGDAGLTLKSSGPMKRNDYNVLELPGSQEVRKIVKWMYDADKGEVAKEIFVFQDPVALYDNKYVVAAYSSKRDKGIASAADVREEVRRKVLNEKKAAKIKADIGGSQDLDAIAGQFNSSVQDASGVSFNQAFAPGLGSEPKVIAAAMGLDASQTSAPIEGQTGVYVVQLTQKPAPTPIADVATARNAASQKYRTQLQSALFPALKKQAKIKDTRYNFY